MALKGAGKRPSTCFISVAGIAQQSLITKLQDSEQTQRRKFRGFLPSDVNETISYHVQITYRIYRKLTSVYCLWLVEYISVFWRFLSVLCGSWCTKRSQLCVLHQSHTQSSFSLASHCCHLPLSLSVCYNWKDWPRNHSNLMITVECPYSRKSTFFTKRRRWGMRAWRRVGVKPVEQSPTEPFCLRGPSRILCGWQLSSCLMEMMFPNIIWHP